MVGDKQLASLAGNAVALARNLPASIVENLANALSREDFVDWPSCRSRIMAGIAHPHYRSEVLRFLENWQANAADVSPQAVCAALLSATSSEQGHRDSQSVELVWTGPDSDAIPLRRTEQAILQVLDSAQTWVTLVSYAVYKIPNISAALVRAARRGVQINVIVETPDKLEGEHEYNTLQALGPDVAVCSMVYYWPRHQRRQTDAGKLGILHVKCVVADRRWLFLSSANLTEYAFSINMELGVLITGGSLPRQVEENFDRLIRLGVLERV